MLTGAHIVIMSTNPEADTAFLRDILELPNVDAGGGFLIFGLPPAEAAMHEAAPEASGQHELYLICEDVHAFIKTMGKHGVECDPIAEPRWGTVTKITLPSGLKLGVYQAHHARPAAKKKAGKALRDTAKAVRRATKKAGKATKRRKR